MLLGWWTPGCLTHLLVDSVPPGCHPPAAPLLRAAWSWVLLSAFDPRLMGLLCPRRLQGSDARVPGAGHRPLLFFCFVLVGSAASQLCGCVWVYTRVRECVHAGGSRCPLCNTSTYRIKPRTAAGAAGSSPGSRWVLSILGRGGGPAGAGGATLGHRGKPEDFCRGACEPLVLSSRTAKRDSISWDKNGNFCSFFSFYWKDLFFSGQLV